MADRLANIGMDTGASMQAHAPSKPGLVQEAMVFVDSDVNYWLEIPQAEQQQIQGSELTSRNLIISRRESARRRSDVRGLVLPSI